MSEVEQKVEIEPPWPKRITVDKRIVKILSESTYDSFPNALKEIIINSYDADASQVNIDIDLKKEIITIEDNGWGMNEPDFSFYLRIAGFKRDKKSVNPSGRHVIGQFGVGFVSIFPFVKNYAIETKKIGSDEVLQAEIPCSIYFANTKKNSDEEIDVSDIRIQGGVKIDKTKKYQQFTKIKLSGFSSLAQEFFHPSKTVKPKKTSIKSYTGLEKLKWVLSENLPLAYSDQRFNKDFNFYTPNSTFNILINNKSLLRPTFGKEFLEMHRGNGEEIGKIKFRYFILTDKKSVNPTEARYLKIRNLNVGVGERTTFGLGTEVGGARSRLHWLTGEIHILDGLNDIISVSRDKFNYSPDYEKLKEYFIKKLSFHSNKLEDEAEIEKFVTETSSGSKVTDLKMLDKTTLKKRINKLKRKFDEKPSLFSEHELNHPKQNRSIKELEDKFSSLERTLVIKGRKYKIETDKWDYNKSPFPACRKESKSIIINKNYPLFKGTKYTDIFVKLHVMLLLKHENGELNQSSYSSFMKDIIVIYEDYKK